MDSITQPDPAAARPAPDSTDPSRGGRVTRDDLGVYTHRVIPDSPISPQPGQFAAPSGKGSNPSANEQAFAQRVAASAYSVPAPIDEDTARGNLTRQGFPGDPA